MNVWAIIIILIILVGAIGYYLAPIKETTKPTIQYTKPIGPTQTYPYQLKSEILINANS